MAHNTILIPPNAEYCRILIRSSLDVESFQHIIFCILVSQKIYIFRLQSPRIFFLSYRGIKTAHTFFSLFHLSFFRDDMASISNPEISYGMQTITNGLVNNLLFFVECSLLSSNNQRAIRHLQFFFGWPARYLTYKSKAQIELSVNQIIHRKIDHMGKHDKAGIYWVIRKVLCYF